MLGRAACVKALCQRHVSWRQSRRGASTQATKSSEEIKPVLPHQYMAFYKYAKIEDPVAASDDLRLRLETLGGLGRIYIAKEGVNAQMSVPTVCYPAWRYTLDDYLRKWKIGDLTMSIGGVASMQTPEDSPFTRLSVKVRNRIVQDALPPTIDENLDLTKVDDIALTPEQWHQKLTTTPTKRPSFHFEQSQSLSSSSSDASAPLVIDCRNYYESQIGLFDHAIRLPVDRYSESFEAIDKLLEPVHDDKEVLLYCTGGIRCEKIGAYLTQVKGRQHVHTLKGGINHYAKYVAEAHVPSAYKGKNYQFDKRNKFGLETESLTEDKLSKCVACGRPDDHMRNCANPVCNILLVLCDDCHVKLHGSCSSNCESVALMSAEERRAYEHAHEEETARLGSLQKFVRSKAYLDEVLKEPSAVEYRKKVTDQHPELIHHPEVSYDKLKGRLRVEADNKLRMEGSTRITPMEMQQYVEKWSSSENAVFRENMQLSSPRAAISVGAYEGVFLTMLARMVAAKQILEIGTFMGYSAMCFADALRDSNGRVLTCDLDHVSLATAIQNFAQHPKGHLITPMHSSGADMLQNCVKEQKQFDLIFIDADKHNFLNYYNTIFDNKLLTPNGVLIVDNTLWRGEVTGEDIAEPHFDHSEDPVELTKSKSKKKENILHTFNKTVHEDPRTVQVILPVRDGISLIQWASNIPAT